MDVSNRGNVYMEEVLVSGTAIDPTLLQFQVRSPGVTTTTQPMWLTWWNTFLTTVEQSEHTPTNLKINFIFIFSGKMKYKNWSLSMTFYRGWSFRNYMQAKLRKYKGIFKAKSRVKTWQVILHYTYNIFRQWWSMWHLGVLLKGTETCKNGKGIPARGTLYGLHCWYRSLGHVAAPDIYTFET